MRTTVRLDDALLAQARGHATETGRTLTQLMADGLVSLIERERGARSPRRLALPVFHGDGLHEGVDINRSATVLERMERGADAPLP